MAVQKYDIPRPASEGGGFEERYWSPLNVPVLGADGSVELIIHNVTDVTEAARLARASRLEGETARALRSQNEWLKAEIERRRIAEETLRQTNDELSATTYAIAHDLRSPLRALDGYAALVLKDPTLTPSPEAVEYLTRIRAAAQRMGQLMDGLLSLARLGRGEVRSDLVDLAAIAQEEFAELARTNPERCARMLASSPIMVTGDERLLRVVIHNLISNAWKFTRHLRNVVIEVGVREGDGPPVYFVKDNGIGFEAEHAAQLFRLFHRLRPEEFDGTGIGLATVRRIIERHGGRVWAEGIPDVGATISFTLGTPPLLAPSSIRWSSGTP